MYEWMNEDPDAATKWEGGGGGENSRKRKRSQTRF